MGIHAVITYFTLSLLGFFNVFYGNWLYNGFYVDCYYYKKGVFLRFVIFEKGISKKTVPGLLRFVSMLFLIFEKNMNKTIVSGFLEFISVLF